MVSCEGSDVLRSSIEEIESSERRRRPRDPLTTADAAAAPPLPDSGTTRGHVILPHCHISVWGRCITQMNISVRRGKSHVLM